LAAPWCEDCSVDVDVSSTKTFELIAQNIDLPVAHEQIVRAAAEFGVTVDKLVEGRRRFSAKLKVTVSGAPSDIKAFRKSVSGSAWDAEGGWVGVVIDTILNW
jgi:hypothetical protein